MKLRKKINKKNHAKQKKAIKKLGLNPIYKSN